MQIPHSSVSVIGSTGLAGPSLFESHPKATSVSRSTSLAWQMLSSSNDNDGSWKIYPSICRISQSKGSKRPIGRRLDQVRLRVEVDTAAFPNSNPLIPRGMEGI